MLQVKLVRSPIGNTARNRATVRALGLRKMHQTVVLPDNASIRGMIFQVKHMLSVEEVDEASAKPRAKTQPKRAKTGGPDAEAKKAKRAKAAQAKAEAKPKAEPKAKAQAKPKAAAKPQAEAKPKSEAKPKAEAKPKVESKAKSPAKPKPAAKKPAAGKSAKKKES
jgi:ribosomal protein L30